MADLSDLPPSTGSAAEEEVARYLSDAIKSPASSDRPEEVPVGDRGAPPDDGRELPPHAPTAKGGDQCYIADHAADG
jgi:hypothetical protein